MRMDLAYTKDAIDEEGRVFLADRHLSIPNAIKWGVVSHGGHIYFPFYRNGEFVRWKSRALTNKKDQKFNILSDEERDRFKFPLWNQRIWPTIDYIIITEGEFDCLAITQLTGSNAVSLPNGASSIESAIKNNYDYLQQFNEIYICTDNDPPGEEAARKAMAILPPNKYRRLSFPCKDANDWIKENPDFTDLQDLMRNAHRVENKAVVSMAHLPPSFYDELDLGISTGWEKLDSILGGLRCGEVTVITADTGAGKSTFCMNLLYHLAMQDQGVWINSYEMAPIITNRKLASIVLRNKMKFKAFETYQKDIYIAWQQRHRCFVNLDNHVPSLQELRALFEIASMAYGLKYIFLDHFDYLWAKGKKGCDLENINEAIRDIHILAMEFKVSVILVVHPKNIPSNKELDMSDIKGSSSIKQYADNILILTRLERLDAKQINKVKIRICKNRLFGVESSFVLNYDIETDRYLE